MTAQPSRHDAPGAATDFVTTDGVRFLHRGRPYHFVGANLWYGAYLGADAAYGNRDRLRRELDDLVALGVRNLRVLASSELSPLKNSMAPAFTTAPGVYNETLLQGLDYLMAEMARRDMLAVLYLNNFWEWSGGMMTYLYWTDDGRYIDPADPAHPWPAFPDHVPKFYANQRAVALYRDYVLHVVNRVNTITGVPYKHDPTLMSWQLANEPRAGETNKDQHQAAYLAWVRDTAALIRAQRPAQLVSLGHDGLVGSAWDPGLFAQAHAHVDYVTAHIWPQNWSWIDPRDIPGTFDGAAAKVADYIARHIDIAQRLGKPLVFEEFGFPRDGMRFDPGTPTSFKDRFYGMVYAAVEDAIRRGTPVAGSNFWGWGGAGRAAHPDHAMRKGDTSYVGDPPHEPQGWYCVFNSDESTQALIRGHAERIAALAQG